MNRILILFAIPLLLLTTVRAQLPITKEIYQRHVALVEKTKATDPLILRLDVELEELVERAKKLETGQVDFLVAGLRPHGSIYATFGMRDTRGFASLLLGKAQYPHVKLHRDAFAGRDLTAEIQTAYAKCAKLFGKPLAKAPIYKVAFGYQKTTNAKMQGVHPRIGRHMVILNRSALTPGRLWDAAIIHETWHCFQKTMAGKETLLARALHEGVVTHLTQVTDPTLEDHTVMLWSKKEWAAATKLRQEIIADFAKNLNSKNLAVLSSYMTLGPTVKTVPGAPSRSGYYVGLLAARAWHKANPKKSVADLLAASDEEIWSALQKKK